MKIEKFREEISLDKKIAIKDREYGIIEIVKFRLDDGSFYIKCFLEDGYVLADDNESGEYIFVKEAKNDLKEPFGDILEYKGEKFKFLYEATAVAEEVWGEPVFKKGESERFWDFEGENGGYLSLGIVDSSQERMDLCGEVLKEEDVELK